MMLFASPCQPSRRRMHMDFVHTVVHLRRVKRKALCCSRQHSGVVFHGQEHQKRLANLMRLYASVSRALATTCL